jgi:hypothetical protein
MRRPCKFRETDLRRAIRAAQKENVPARIDVMPDGRISIIPVAVQAAVENTPLADANEWDIAPP